MLGTPRTVLAVLATALLLSSCTGGSDSSDSPDEPDASSSLAPEERPPGKAEAVESGLGVDGQRAVGVAVVQNQSSTDGQSIRVDFAFQTKAGRTVTTVSRSASFADSDQSLVVVGQADLTGLDAKVAAVDVSVTVTNADVVPLAAGLKVTGGKVADTKAGPTATFTVVNESEDDLVAGALAVACRNARGSIIGGGFASVPALEPGERLMVRAGDLVLSGPAERCSASPASA
ncbi:MAG: hypothetical protein F2667_07380 [Actinobacteria bacterium]|uniref:Unannotated protein n=1 Tax=freshwater metagenome TaxID=449393 RepID=A0A6J6QDL4_9ZZZZ|nr:hypothetical protein [Actinomycetota bacterium]